MDVTQNSRDFPMKESQNLDFAECETGRISVSWPGQGGLARLACRLLSTSGHHRTSGLRTRLLCLWCWRLGLALGSFGLRKLGLGRWRKRCRRPRTVSARRGLRMDARLEDDRPVLDLQALEPADHLGVLGVVISVLGQVLLAQLRQKLLRRALAVDLERLQRDHQNAVS